MSKKSQRLKRRVAIERNAADQYKAQLLKLQIARSNEVARLVDDLRSARLELQALKANSPLLDAIKISLHHRYDVHGLFRVMFDVRLRSIDFALCTQKVTPAASYPESQLRFISQQAADHLYNEMVKELRKTGSLR